MTEAADEYFDRVAPQWDALRGGYFPEAVRAAAIARAYLRPEMVVADVGTGTGFVAAGLAPLVQRVYALDGSAAMLRQAQKNLAAFDNVVLEVADGESLPLPDGSVDAVFANMVLHHCPDPAAAIAEMVRVLKPGGRLMLTDLDTHTHEWMRQEMADEWLGLARPRVRAWLRAAGLVNIVVDCTESSCCATSAAPATAPQDRQAQVSVFLATGTRRMPASAAVQARYGELAAGERCGCGAPAAAEASCCAPPADAAAPGPPSTPAGCCAPVVEAAPREASCCAPPAAAVPPDPSSAPAGRCAPVVEAAPREASCCAPPAAAVPPDPAATPAGCCAPVVEAAPREASCCAPPAAVVPPDSAATPASCCAPPAAVVPPDPAATPASCCAPPAAAASCCAAPPPPRDSCCTPAAPRDEPVRFAAGYTPEQMAAVPPEAADFSLGCGNPVLAAGLQPGETVLDIGSGGGIDAFSAARQVGPAGQVIGLDMTPEMIARAEDSARHAGLTNVSFRQGQAEAMPVEDGTVDVILSNCVINLAEDKGQVFQEAYRVMKEGGRLVVSDMVSAGPLPPALRRRTDLWAHCVVGALPEAEYVDLIRQAGFGGVQVRRSTIGGTVAGVRVYSALVTARKPARGG